jgi:hypothetical protein
MATSEALKNNIEINDYISQTKLLKHILNDTPWVNYRYHRECTLDQINIPLILVCLIPDFSI